MTEEERQLMEQLNKRIDISNKIAYHNLSMLKTINENLQKRNELDCAIQEREERKKRVREYIPACVAVVLLIIGMIIAYNYPEIKMHIEMNKAIREFLRQMSLFYK